jgi:hypothetical protein
MYRVIVTSSVEERRAWLDEVRATITIHFPGED